MFGDILKGRENQRTVCPPAYQGLSIMYLVDKGGRITVRKTACMSALGRR